METMHAFGFAMLGFFVTLIWLFAIPFMFPGFSWDKHLFVKVKEPKYWESHKKEYLQKIAELQELLTDRKGIYTSQTQMAEATISNLRDKVLKLSEDIGKKQFFIDNLKRENEELSEMIFQQLLEEELDDFDEEKISIKSVATLRKEYHYLKERLLSTPIGSKEYEDLVKECRLMREKIEMYNYENNVS